MQAGWEVSYIQLPPLPNNEPDKYIHTTIRYYHHKPSKAGSSTHHLNPELRYLNPRYTVPDFKMPWTGAEDSLLLEQIPHTAHHGLRDTSYPRPGDAWEEIACQMRDRSRERNISTRPYTRGECIQRYMDICKRIEDEANGISGPDGHRGVNPYGHLIPIGYPLHMNPIIGFDWQLTRTSHYEGERTSESQPTVNV